MQHNGGTSVLVPCFSTPSGFGHLVKAYDSILEECVTDVNAMLH